jgi:hypothetical protein
MTKVTEFLRSVIILDTDPVIDLPADRPVRYPGRVAALVLAAAGLVLGVVGSFLPWVVSGQVRRSSYAVTGMVDRLGIAGDGVLGFLVAGWPLIGLLCATPVVAALLRRWAVAGTLCVLLGIAMTAVSLALLAVSGSGAIGVQVDPIGPSVTSAGGMLLTVGGVWLVIGVWRNPGLRHRPNG